ncbi:MAG TPA: protease HtpX [Arenimonas sp.]|nr:protease HtpX [Arenimonas sp.]HOZ05810.1 protease HtpX [Arenimonas sp.]HPW33775.1 protease HtpX [Arenimonas sp.]
MFNRVALFLATNFAILLLVSLIFKVFGLDMQAARYGTNLGSLLVMCAVFGFAGSFISLAMSKWTAKRATGMTVIDQPRNEIEQWLLNTVRRQADKAGIKMPEVGIYEAPEINAFATGMSRNSSLVAVSSGLLRGMTRDEAEAVLGHEISHVANGDMVTLTLIQGVVNTFVMFLARVIGSIVDKAVLGNREGRGLGYFAIVFVLEIVFGLFASMIVMYFSRWREFRADAGGANLAGKQKMVAALERLASHQAQSSLPTQIAAFGISGNIAHGLKRLFMSHPPLAERIATLKNSSSI